MSRKVRKALILTAKLAVAALLLWYVLGSVRWFDHAVTAEGVSLRVHGVRQAPAGADELLVADASGSGPRWREAGDFRPVSLRTRDGQTAIVHASEPDWRSPRRYLVQLPAGWRRWMDAGEFRPDGVQVVRRGFLTTIASVQPVLLAATCACFVLPVLILAVRWWYLLRILDIRIALWEAVRLTFLGQFFNFVVPGTVSGDLVKAYYAARHTDRKAATLVSVFVDRLVGLLQFVVLPAVVIAGMWAASGWNERLFVPAVVVGVTVAGVAAGLGLLLSPALRRVLRLGKIIRRLPLQRHVAVLAEAAGLYRRRATGLLKALALTFGGQVAFITAIMLAGLSLHLPVPAYQYFLYVPLIYIIAAVPISPGGLGLAETFYLAFLVPAGAAPGEVLALAVVARLVPMIVALPGLVVALRGARLPPPERMKAELAVPQNPPL